MATCGIPRLVAAVLLLAGAGCDSPSAPRPVTETPQPPPIPVPLPPVATPSPSAWQESQRLTVEEAVYRFQFVEYRSQPQIGPLTYCVARTATDDIFSAPVWTDPPPELMLRFRDHRPPVKRMAVCRIHTDVSGVTDVETGGRAVIFRVATPVWESDTEVLVDGGYYYNGISASGKTYRVRFQGGEWVVVDARWRWIS